MSSTEDGWPEITVKAVVLGVALAVVLAGAIGFYLPFKLAIPIVISGRMDVLAVLPEPLGAWPGVIILAGIGYWLYRVGTTGARGSKG